MDNKELTKSESMSPLPDIIGTRAPDYRGELFDAEEPSTIVELLQRRAITEQNRCAYTFLNDKGMEKSNVTYAHLNQRAKSIAAALQRQVPFSYPVILDFPAGQDFLDAFFGCIYAGIPAVPVYRSRHNSSMLDAVVANTGAHYGLTLASLLNSWREPPGRLHWIASDEIADHESAAWRDPKVQADSAAFLQYTSGSTAAPKGTVVTHGNVLANERMICAGFEHTENSVVLGWLPLFHDMGLIGNALQPLYVGCRCILMPPTAFMLRPYRWLEAISRYRATTSGAPNFAYEWCTRKISPEQREGLDLSCWTVAFNGSEPVRAETIDKFSEYFLTCGFRREAFYPCYGLAEATLLVSGGTKAEAPVFRELQTDQGHSRKVVSCGNNRFGQSIRIVNPETCCLCEPGTIGEIWVKGPCVAQGYWMRPELENPIFKAYVQETGEGPFLRTGDLGILQDEELFIFGRLKDIIIIRGRKYHPEDIEKVVEKSHPKLKIACGAAFSVDLGNREGLVIAHEVERHTSAAEAQQILQTIIQAVAAEHDQQVYSITLLRSGTIPRTSSGKIQRSRCREMFLSRTLDLVASYFQSQKRVEEMSYGL
jgi:acyl-CoA synthetase (AMP-forming)/AMP-acid ligase II